MDVERLGIHESVEAIFPPDVLRDELADEDLAVTVVGDDLDDVDAVVTFEYREQFLDLAWVHSVQAGVDRFPFEEFERRDVALTNSTGIHGTSIGETVAGYMLSFARRLHVHRDNQNDREWRQPAWDEAFTLDGESVCVVGLGTLGRGIVEHASALGMTVTGVRRSGEPVPGVERVHTPDELHEAVADSLFVAVTVPLNDETHHLVDGAVLDAMREDAYLVNVARGGVVDQAALVETLESGGLAGAALDVFEEEPLPADSPLWDMEEVIVTPHSGAFTVDYFRDVADIVRENLERMAAGEDLFNRVA